LYKLDLVLELLEEEARTLVISRSGTNVPPVNLNLQHPDQRSIYQAGDLTKMDISLFSRILQKMMSRSEYNMLVQPMLDYRNKLQHIPKSSIILDDEYSEIYHMGEIALKAVGLTQAEIDQRINRVPVKLCTGNDIFRLDCLEDAKKLLTEGYKSLRDLNNAEEALSLLSRGIKNFQLLNLLWILLNQPRKKL
jgi:hypothetical protein